MQLRYRTLLMTILWYNLCALKDGVRLETLLTEFELDQMLWYKLTLRCKEPTQ